MDRVSIVIPARNEERFLPECLQSVQAQTYPHNLLEIILIDSDSSDGTREIMEEFAAASDIAVRVFDHPRGDTPGALNIGFRNAVGEFVFHLIAHVSIEPDHIERAIRKLHEMDADAICGRIITTGSGEASFWDNGISAAMASVLGIGNATARVSAKPQWLDNPMQAIYKRELFDKFGYLDERLTRNQDYEFHQRCHAGGARFWFEPELKIFYRSRRTLAQLWRQYFNAAKWRTFMIGRYRGAVKARHLVPPVFFLSLLASGIAAILWQPALVAFAAILGAYCIAIIVGTIWAIVRRKSASILIALPVALATIHFAFALGFIAGFFHFIIFGKRKQVAIAEKQTH